MTIARKEKSKLTHTYSWRLCFLMRFSFPNFPRCFSRASEKKELSCSFTNFECFVKLENTENMKKIAFSQRRDRLEENCVLFGDRLSRTIFDWENLEVIKCRRKCRLCTRCIVRAFGVFQSSRARNLNLKRRKFTSTMNLWVLKIIFQTFPQHRWHRKATGWQTFHSTAARKLWKLSFMKRHRTLLREH